MKRYYPFLLALLALVLPGASAWSDLSTYGFTVSSGNPYDMSGSTSLFNGNDACSGINIDDNANSATNIGFNFVFDGTTYTKFSASTNGVIGLYTSSGSGAVTANWDNNLTATTGGNGGTYNFTLASAPQITAYWDDMRVPDAGCYEGDGFDGSISYLLTGTAPNRVLVIEWNSIEFDYYDYYYASRQVRLYETTNSIEFWYDDFGSDYYGDGASIGLAAQNATSFVSVTPGSGGSASVSSSIPNNSVNPTSPSIPANTVYTFTPCRINITGNPSEGGTTLMNSGDQLLAGQQLQVGSSKTFQPFSMALSNSVCASRTYSFSITGPAAVNYSISPSSGTVNANTTVTPTLTYTPRCAGNATATFTITASDGTNRSYTLAAVAIAQNQWTTNVSQGGTATLASGDTLLKGQVVPRKTTMTFQPFSIKNSNISPGATSTQLTYTLTDPTGQYSISPANATLNGNQTSTPTISFTGTGVGNQPATLVVSDGCDTRTFVLFAFSAAPGGVFILNSQQLGPGIGAFVNYSSCVGEYANTQAITVTNTGFGDFNINSIKFYQTDTVYRQGTPSYPLLRDKQGNPIPLRDYIITTQPGVAPVTANQMPVLPIVVPTGASRTLYLTYIGQYPGKRFARAYINTNGQNFLGTDVSGEQVEGLLTFDLFGRATGSLLSDNPNGGVPKAVIFPTTRAGDSSFATFTLMNPGVCDLRISKSAFGIYSGDVSEFTIVSGFAGIATDSVPQLRNDYLLAPGQSTTVTVRFKPSRSGSRRVTLLLRTNDSTVQIPGLTEPGAYYMDLYGIGKTGLDYTDLKLPNAVIDAPANAGGTSTGTIELINASKEPQTIKTLALSGASISEIVVDPSQPWPTLPTVVAPGQTLKLAVMLMPTAGSQPGVRTAQLDVTLNNNEAFSVAIEGYAGTRQLTVTPATLFAGTTVALGTLERRTVTVSNLSTVAVTVQQPVITGADAGDYQVQKFVRLVLQPGQMEFLELSYVPSKPGSTSAQLEIMSDATNGKQTVALSATGAIAQHESDPASQGTAGVGAEAGIAGAELLQSVPNPTMGGTVEIGYRLKEASRVELRLYDAAGKEVRVMERGMNEAGEHTVKLDVSELSSGSYRYRLSVNGVVLSRQLTIVK